MSFPSPALTAPSLENWRFEFNGLELGAGTEYGIVGIEGLDLGGPVRAGDVVLPRDHGQTRGLDLLGGRDIIFDLWIAAKTNTLATLQKNLGYATMVQPSAEIPLWFQLPGLPVLCSMCRPRTRKGKIDVDYATSSVYKPELAFHATDPRLYGQGQSLVISAEETAHTGGVKPPFTFPLSFGATVPVGVAVTNAGNFETRPLLILTGPLPAPTITNTTVEGEPHLQLVRPGAEEPTIAAGDQVLIDLGNPHRILYYAEGIEAGRYSQGYEPEDIYSWLTGESVWWDLPAETTSQVTLRTAAPSAGTCEIQWSSAYTL